MKRGWLGFAVGCTLATPLAPMTAMAQAPEAQSDTVFVLGRVESAARDRLGATLGGAVIGPEETRTFDRQTLDEAIDLIPGASASATGGSRNERLIFIRGFDRFQTTLSIDGVRVFLPADNRIDFARFLTADLAEIQVSKGYVSVLDGPGGVGGAVNLVTRKPGKPFEAEASVGVSADRALGYNGHIISGVVGGRMDGQAGAFYAQASGVSRKQDDWTLPKDFRPTVLEDGGERENSESEDWRVSLKAGWEPNETDEYAIGYIRTSGEKNAPYHVTDTASARFWTWPYWDTESVYFLSSTQLAAGLTLKSRVYRNTFDNLLSSYDNAAQTIKSLPRSFESYYSDESWGANATLTWEAAPSNTLAVAAHYRTDKHRERQDGFTRTPASGSPSVNARFSEPWQTTEEDTFSIAIEDTQRFGERIDLVLGASYDWTDLRKAEDANVQVTGTTIANSVISFLPVTYPLRDMDGWNAQAALAYRPNDATRFHASVSSRIRFPTLFERFSSRFGTAIPNPDIEPERALNLEAGWSWEGNGINFSGAVFRSDLTDALIQIPVALGAPFGTVNQTRNVGDGNYYGAEFSVRGDVLENLVAGGHVTLMRREFEDPSNRAFQPQGVPDARLFAYADWRVTENISLTPSMEVASSRWTVTTSAAITPPRFYETGNYTLFNLAADWRVAPGVSLLAGVKNITDELYVLTDGFPEEGRSYHLSLRVKK